MFSTELGASAPAQLIRLEGRKDPEYWVGFHNFYVITRYNRSIMYALAAHQLGQAVSESANPATVSATVSGDIVDAGP